MNSKENKSAGNATAPQVVINIIVDSGFLYNYADPHNFNGKGLFIMDNGKYSSNEASPNLVPRVNVGDQVAFNIFPINMLGNKGNTVQITDFTPSEYFNIFGKQGMPVSCDPETPYQWIGIVNSGGEGFINFTIEVCEDQKPFKYFKWHLKFCC